jgi:N-acetylglucosamine-6-phosphate deacetylase
VLTQDQAVRNVVAWAKTSVAEACQMASEVPAHVLGLSSKGRLVEGYDADLVLLDESLRVQTTFREGRCIYSRSANGEAVDGARLKKKAELV